MYVIMTPALAEWGVAAALLHASAATPSYAPPKSNWECKEHAIPEAHCDPKQCKYSLSGTVTR